MSTQQPAWILDNATISTENPFEISYLQERLGVTAQDVRDAIKAVGNDRREVVAYLERRKRAGKASLQAAL